MILEPKFVGRFKARTADGREVEILQYVRMIDPGPTFGDPHPEPIEGMPFLVTAGGQPVNHVGGDEFEVVDVESFTVQRV
jgi:hypothetical protein